MSTLDIAAAIQAAADSSTNDINNEQASPVSPNLEHVSVPDTPRATKVILRGRVLMLYAGAGNKFVSRHLELHPGGQLRVLLDGASEPQAIIDLRGCILADYPENQVLGFSLCRTASESDPYSPSRLGQFIFMCLHLEDKRRWMEAIQDSIWSDKNDFGGNNNNENESNNNNENANNGENNINNNEEEETAGLSKHEGTATSNVKQSSWNKIRFSTSNYVIDRGCRPALLQGFLLKRTGTFLQDYVVRWCELRDRVSTETTSLGGIVYAAYLMAPPGEWSFVPMRIDTTVTKHQTKKRICVAGANQDSVFFKFEVLEQMEEWASSLEMLVERAKIENDPEFAMEMKLEYQKTQHHSSSSSSNNKNGKNNNNEDSLLGETMHLAGLRNALKDVGNGDDNDGDDDNNNLYVGYDSQDDDENEKRKKRKEKEKFKISPNPKEQMSEIIIDADDLDSDTEYEMKDLMSESPQRVHFITMLYALDRSIHADRDSDYVVPKLVEILASPPWKFRPEYSPWNNDRRQDLLSDIENNNTSSTTETTSVSSPVDFASASAAANFGGSTMSMAISASFDPNARDETTCEDVLERFERRIRTAQEILGPSVVLGRLLKELDVDSNDLRFVAQYVVDHFPRQLKAAMIAARLDQALSDYQAIRENILVRQDMARFREDFRISNTTTTNTGGSSSTSASSGVAVGSSSSVGSTGEGLSINTNTMSVACALVSSPRTKNPGGVSFSSANQNNSSEDTDSLTNESTVDDAVKLINRIVIQGKQGTRGGGKSGIREALQFLNHFLSQFREAFDVFDDAGFTIDEVGSAVERGTKSLQEL